MRESERMKSKRAKSQTRNVVQFPGASKRPRSTGSTQDCITAEGLLDINEWITGGDPGYRAYVEDETIRFANPSGRIEWVLIKVP
jgi:hypothetical protein